MAGTNEIVPIEDKIVELYSYSATHHKLFTTQEHQFICHLEKKKAFLKECANFTQVEIDALEEIYNRFMR